MRRRRTTTIMVDLLVDWIDHRDFGFSHLIVGGIFWRNNLDRPLEFSLLHDLEEDLVDRLDANDSNVIWSNQWNVYFHRRVEDDPNRWEWNRMVECHLFRQSKVVRRAMTRRIYLVGNISIDFRQHHSLEWDSRPNEGDFHDVERCH